MATYREGLVKDINNTIDNSIEKFNTSIPEIQKNILKEVSTLVKNLDYNGDNIAVTAKNMRVIGEITKKLRRIIFSTDYTDQLKDYLKAFTGVTTLQNSYMRSVLQEFKITPVLEQIKVQSIDATANSLTEQGITANVIDVIKGVLRRNITTGGTFNQLMDQVRDTILTNKSGEGILERYVKRITTDSLNQYSRNYLQTATEGSNLVWYRYSGSNIKTTRCFCLAMTEREWFHISEVPQLIKGNFPEFQEKDCAIYDKTGLPDGMVAGTNIANFLTYLGGYNCGHRAIPTPTVLVPKEIRERIKG